MTLAAPAAVQPGPEVDKWDVAINGNHLVMETINITSMNTNQTQLNARIAHVVVFQEHGMDS